MLIGMTLLAAAAASTAATPPHRLTLEEAVQQVQRETAGHVLSAESVRDGRTGNYRVKVLGTDGRVRVVEIDSEPSKKAPPAADPRGNKETH